MTETEQPINLDSFFERAFSRTETRAETAESVQQKQSEEPAQQSNKIIASPKCSNCGLEMNLIEDGTLWFCPFGCESLEVEKL
ncbi:MAG: hypothetical protein LC768_03505 [Acidobacteria bacterium]|nr:hypothetical protein [Acidobacteriota bacterium]MCA1637394.1 hypothetical protein [Acidobacteriota bacterium]